MWSVNTWPKPGDSSARARTSSGTRCADACRSKLIVEFGLAFIADPPSHGPGAVARPDAVPRPCRRPASNHLDHLPAAGLPAGRHRRVPSLDAADRSPRWRRLAGYSLGYVVADLFRAPGGPFALPLKQIVGHRLLDP